MWSVEQACRICNFSPRGVTVDARESWLETRWTRHPAKTPVSIELNWRGPLLFGRPTMAETTNSEGKLSLQDKKLHKACVDGDAAALEKLLKAKKANPGCVREGRSALHACVEHDHHECAALLLAELPAKVHVQHHQPLEHTRERSFVEICPRLVHVCVERKETV